MSITTDVIVGFPAEDDAEFSTSLAFVREMEFSGLHVFRYSPRRGTAAAAMDLGVAPAVAQQRSNRMHALASELESRFRERFVGRTLGVLWESDEPRLEGVQWSGLTGNYLRVVTHAREGVDLANRVTDTVLAAVQPGALPGTVSDMTWGRTAPRGSLHGSPGIDAGGTVVRRTTPAPGAG